MPKNNETTTTFNVNISELKSAMQEAKRQISVTNSEFKAISSSMDDWSKSTDGLQAKINQLDSNLVSQKKILRSLEDQYELVVAEQGKGSAGADRLKIAMNNQQAAINKTENELGQFKDQLKQVEKAELTAVKTGKDVSDVLKDLENDAEDAGEGFTVLKGALAGIVADGIKEISSALKDLITDSSEAYAQFSAATGIATEAMGEYEEAIKSIYKNNFGESLEDVANKMAKVKEVTKELDASKLQEMTEKAITLEDVFGMDMTETLRGVQSLMTHFGMTSEEAFDYISSGAQNGLNYTDELGDNISEYAGKFAEAGYTAEEYFQLLQNGSEGGAYNLDKVNDAINEVTARLADGTIGDSIDMFSGDTQKLFEAWQNGGATQKEVIDSIVKDIQNTTGEQEKMNKAAKAFGTMAEDGGTKFIESLTSVGDTFDDVQGKADELANTKYDTPAAAISGIGRTLKTDLLQPIVDSLLPYLNQLADWVTKNLPNIIDKVKEVGKFISAISPILAGLGTALAVLKIGSIITTLINGFIALGGAAGILAKGITVVKLAMAAVGGPVTIVIAIIAALLAAFVVLWKKSDKFREFWINLWEIIKTACGNAIEGIGKFFTETLPNFFTSVIDWIKENWPLLLTMLVNPFAGLFKYFYDNNKQFKNFVDNAINQIKQLPPKVWTWLQNTISKITTWAANLKTKGKESATQFLSSITDNIKELPSKVKTKIDEVLPKIVTWGTNLGKKGKTAAETLFNSVVDNLKNLPDNIKSIGGDLVEGLWNGINDKVEWIKSKLSGFKDAVMNALKDFFGIASPSKVMADEIGKWLPEGIAVGIDKNAKSVLSSMKDLTTGAVNSAKTGLSGVSGSINTNGAVAGGVVNNFYQTNNSPKALSRLEIYRQSKNLLGYAGGV